MKRILQLIFALMVALGSGEAFRLPAEAPPCACCGAMGSTPCGMGTRSVPCHGSQGKNPAPTSIQRAHTAQAELRTQEPSPWPSRWLRPGSLRNLDSPLLRIPLNPGPPGRMLDRLARLEVFRN